MVEEKLKARKAIKSRKPTFKRSQTNQFSKFKGDGYRAPKGMGNKLRRGRKGHQKKPTTGFGSPNEVKGMNKDGKFEVIVSNVADLANVKDKHQVAVISSKTGAKKRLEILNEAKKLKLAIANVKDLDAAIKKYTKEKKVAKKAEPKKEAKTESKKETPKEDKKE